MYILWCILGLFCFLGGCRLAITAEKLEASSEIYAPKVESANMEFKANDQNSNESGTH